jgi:hypothetical protein
MKKIPIFLIIVFIAMSCEKSDLFDYKNFDYDLRGTWVSNDPSVYSGSLIIDYDKITISGYSEIQTPPEGNDARRPFRDFIKKVPLSGYSEDGRFYIMNMGEWHVGIPYTYWTEDYGRYKFLRFDFGGRMEILRFEMK